jgi:DNA-binding CsgD family transcriptional regulator/tetratricopeptide (TPR) repeat protein
VSRRELPAGFLDAVGHWAHHCDMQLLEREPFCASLNEYADAAMRGTGRLVLVSGEAGVGKTSLLQVLREHGQYQRWLQGSFDGSFTPDPLRALLDIADEVGGEFAELCRTETRWEVLYRSFLETLRGLPGMTVLVFEDAHWADEATLDLVGFLSRRMDSMSLLIIVTYRDDGLSRGHPLRALLGELMHAPSSRLITLPTLSEHAVRSLAADSPVEPEELYRLTGGNPFYIGEVLASGSTAVPPSAVAAVDARLARLSEEARAVVDAASIVGTRVELDVLVRLVSSDPAVIDECLTSGALVSEPGAFRFRHELIRLAVEESIPAHRRMALHESVLRALLANGSKDAARLAHHAETAGDAEAVMNYAPLAGRRAAALSSHREAIVQFQRALRYSDQLDPADSALLYGDLAAEFSLVDRWEDAVEASRESLRLWLDVGDVLRAADTKRQLSVMLWRIGQGADALEEAREATSLLEPLGDTAELGWAHAALAKNLDPSDSECLEHGWRAVSLADVVGDLALKSDALNTIGCSLIQNGEDGFAELQQSLECAREAGALPQLARAYGNLQGMQYGMYQLRTAEQTFHEAIAFIEEHDISTYGHCLRGVHALVLCEMGRWSESVSLADGILAQPFLSASNHVNPLHAAGLVHARRGDPRGIEMLEESLRITHGMGSADYIAAGQLALLEGRWLTGDLAAARELADLLAEQRALEEPWFLGEVAVWRRRLGLGVSVRDRYAQPFALQLEGNWRAAADEWSSIGAPYRRGLALLDSGVEEGLREALDVFDRLGARAASDIAKTELRRLGVTAIPRGRRSATRDDPLGLTPREREVLELIGAGATNADIADRLVISPKTVDNHVSSVFAKLGVDNRRAAAEMLLAVGA